VKTTSEERVKKSKRKASGEAPLSVSVAVEREVITYSHMWYTSECLLKRGQEQEAHSFHQFMASLVFTAFTLEAYLNHVGPRLLQCWEYLERHQNPLDKLKLIGTHLGVTVNYGIRPWKIVRDLFEFRNAIAHGKSITFRPPVEVVSLEEHETDISMARTKWELFCTQNNAESARADVEKMVLILYEAAKAAGYDTGLPFVKGGQSSDVSLRSPQTRSRRSSK
jgi:hypothetical protein